MLILSIMFCVSLFISCNKRQQKFEIKTQGLHVLRQEKIYFLDKKLSFGSESPLYTSSVDGIFYLVFNNKLNGSVDIYEYDQSNLYKRIKFDERTKSKLTEFAGSKLITLDSILIVNNYFPSRSFFINDQGEIIHSLTFDMENELPLSYLNVVQSSMGDIISYRNKMILRSWEVSINQSEGLDPNYNFSWLLDLEKETLNPIPVTYPLGYIQKKIDSYAALTVWQSVADSLIIYSFPQSDSVKIYNLKSGETQTSLISSEIRSTPPYQVDNSSFEKYAKATLNSGILYDSTNEYYYLFRQMPLRMDSDIGTSKFEINIKKPINIEVLNYKFESLGTIQLPSQQYDIFKSFVKNGRLHVSRNNIFSDEMDENKLVFDVFSISLL